MNEYELLYVVSGEETEDVATKVTDQINSALMKMGGKIAQEDTWGRKRLAYEIAKQAHGWYVVARFNLDGDKVAEFDGQLRLNGKLIRHLILRSDELPTAEEAAKAEEILQSSRERKPAGKPEDKPAAKPAPVAAEKTEEKPAEKAEEKPAKPKKETAAEKKARQSELDAKLGEILKEE